MNPTLSRLSWVRPLSFRDDVETPSRNTLPDVGKSMAPARLSSVDFPQPLRPTNATNSPRSTLNERPLSACTGWPSVRQSFETSFNERIAIGSRGPATLSEAPRLHRPAY